MILIPPSPLHKAGFINHSKHVFKPLSTIYQYMIYETVLTLSPFIYIIDTYNIEFNWRFLLSEFDVTSWCMYVHTVGSNMENIWKGHRGRWEITFCAEGEIYLQDCDKPWHCGTGLKGFWESSKSFNRELKSFAKSHLSLESIQNCQMQTFGWI